ncbi:TPA: polysaccharide biosynthesis C-terminal domain-containing protein, partial [Streptococcus suis]
MLVISFPIVKLFYSSENLVFFYLLIISTMVYNYANQFARGIGLTKEYAISGVFSTLITVISNIILLVVLDYGVDGYVISYILSYLLPFLYLSFCIISSIGINFKFSKDILIECLTFSIPLVPNAVLWWLINGANRLLILQYVGSVGNGIFAVANKLPMLLTLVTGIFLQAWQLSAYEEYGNSENIEYNRVVFKMYSQFLFLFGIGISIFSKLYFETFIDPRYNEAKSFVYLLILAVIFQSLSGFLGTIYTSARDTKGVLSSSSTGAAISIILSYFLTKSYGVLGSSIGTLIGFFVMYIFRLFDTKKFVDLTSEAKGVFFLSILILIQGLLNSFV